jgi:predicted SnoaL-like aldol condensation-catalyzing enzyme
LGHFDRIRLHDVIVKLRAVSAAGDAMLVYESPMTTKDGHETTISSMEIFRVVDGRIVEVWNCGYKQGVWQ